MIETTATPDLRPNPAILIGAGGALALLSAAFYAWPVAIASTVLGILMIAGADVDARNYLLPDAVTIGATVAGILAAPLIDPFDPLFAGVSAIMRAIGCAAVLGENGSKLRSARHRLGIVERLVYPALGKDPIGGIRRSDLIRMLDKIAEKNGEVMRDHVLVRKLMNCHLSRSDEFCSPIVPGMARTKSSERARDRVLSETSSEGRVLNLWMNSTALYGVGARKR